MSRGPSRLCLRRISVKRSGVIKRHAHLGFIAFRPDEGMGQLTQPFERRFLNVLKYAAQQINRSRPFLGLKPKEDRRLVRKILIQRSDADAGLLGYPRRRKAWRTFLG